MAEDPCEESSRRALASWSHISASGNSRLHSGHVYYNGPVVTNNFGSGDVTAASKQGAIHPPDERIGAAACIAGLLLKASFLRNQIGTYFERFETAELPDDLSSIETELGQAEEALRVLDLSLNQNAINPERAALISIADLITSHTNAVLLLEQTHIYVVPRVSGARLNSEGTEDATSFTLVREKLRWQINTWRMQSTILSGSHADARVVSAGLQKRIADQLATDQALAQHMEVMEDDAETITEKASLYYDASEEQSVLAERLSQNTLEEDSHATHLGDIESVLRRSGPYKRVNPHWRQAVHSGSILSTGTVMTKLSILTLEHAAILGVLSLPIHLSELHDGHSYTTAIETALQDYGVSQDNYVASGQPGASPLYFSVSDFALDEHSFPTDLSALGSKLHREIGSFEQKARQTLAVGASDTESSAARETEPVRKILSMMETEFSFDRLITWEKLAALTQPWSSYGSMSNHARALKIIAIGATSASRLVNVIKLFNQRYRSKVWKALRLVDLAAVKQDLLTVRSARMSLDVCNKAVAWTAESLIKVPREITHIMQSTVEDLRLEKSFRALPSTLASFVNLKVLSIRDEDVQELPPALCTAPNLAELDLSCDRLTALPESFTEMTSLRKLALGRNAFTEFPRQLCRLPYLQSLSMSTDKLADLPSEIGQMTALRVLKLDGPIYPPSQLATFPVELYQLENLETLCLSGNVISTLPDDLSRLAALRELDLMSNRLKHFPKSLTQLARLETLYLWGNQLEEIPEDVELLTNLRVLQVAQNSLRRLPVTLARMESLECLFIHDNPFSEHASIRALLNSKKYRGRGHSDEGERWKCERVKELLQKELDENATKS